MNPFQPITYINADGTVNADKLKKICSSVAKQFPYGDPNEVHGYMIEDDHKAYGYLARRDHLRKHDSDNINYFVSQ
jgi:hypothetical protein